MVKPVVEVLSMKRQTDLALDELSKDIFGEEIEPEKEPEDERKVAIQHMASYLNRFHGQHITAQLCGTGTISNIKHWMQGKSEPNEWQLRFMRQAYEITMILAMKLKRLEVRDWWLRRNEYLAGYTPMALFQSDPNGVRMAAMDFLMTAL